eukprot:scaffold7349_cov173-Amphora_coffeaeformis.AAC.4
MILLRPNLGEAAFVPTAPHRVWDAAWETRSSATVAPVLPSVGEQQEIATMATTGQDEFAAPKNFLPSFMLRKPVLLRKTNKRSHPACFTGNLVIYILVSMCSRGAYPATIGHLRQAVCSLSCFLRFCQDGDGTTGQQNCHQNSAKY